MLTKNHTPTLNMTSVMDMVVMVTTTVVTTTQGTMLMAATSTVQATILMQHLRMMITVTITPPTLKKRIPLTNF
jgi:hypothetical protein